MIQSTKIITSTNQKQTLKIITGEKAVLIIIKGKDFNRISFWRRVKQAIELIRHRSSEGIIFISKQDARSLGGYLLNLD